MNDVFTVCGISRQAHHQALQRHLQEEQKAVLYVRLMEQVREIHPGMGLKTMYDMAQPEGIGRDAFIALGLQEGFRLKTIEKQTRTTYSVKSHRYNNLLGDVEFSGINQLWSSETIKAYNESRPHQSLNKISPVEYENYLLRIPEEKRSKMKIYTIKLNADASITKQLNLFNKEN
jgi:hypothetical protein